jgi:hypothetical protein
MAHYSELSGSIFISEITGSNVPLSTPISVAMYLELWLYQMNTKTMVQNF